MLSTILTVSLLLANAQPLCRPVPGVQVTANPPYVPGTAPAVKARQMNQCAENNGVAAIESAAENIGVLAGAESAARLTPIEPLRAKEIFDQIKNDRSLSFNNPVDGCFARSHLVASRLQRMGIASSKVWLYEGDRQRLRVERGGRKFEWEFHVANLIAVKKEGCVELMVIDPGVADAPVSIQDWQAAQTKHAPNQPSQIKITSRFDYDQPGSSNGRQTWNCALFRPANELNRQYLRSSPAAPPTAPGPRGGVTRWQQVLWQNEAWAATSMNETLSVPIRFAAWNDSGVDLLIGQRAAYYHWQIPAKERIAIERQLKVAATDQHKVKVTLVKGTAEIQSVRPLKRN